MVAELLVSPRLHRRDACTTFLLLLGMRRDGPEGQIFNVQGLPAVGKIFWHSEAASSRWRDRRPRQVYGVISGQ